MAIMKMRLAPKRSAIQPEIGRNTAEASRYMVMARFSLSGSTCRAWAIAGRALLIEVAFSVCIKSAEPMIAGITQPRSVASRPSLSTAAASAPGSSSTSSTRISSARVLIPRRSPA
jgi:hypothetical protein